jgi:hypothetical protein
MDKRTENKLNELLKYSDPVKAQQNAFKKLGKDALLYISSRKDKKYMIKNPNTGKWVHFGQFKPPYEDFLKHGSQARRQNYLKRSNFIRGNWRDDPYSSNNLSRVLLWDG